MTPPKDTPNPDTPDPDAIEPDADVPAADNPDTREGAGDLSNPDHIDALLRDVNTPGDVRAFVSAVYAVDSYLARMEFYKDGDGLTHVRPRENA